MADPAISVLVPVYNARQFVGEAIESLLAQSRRDFELLLFDDGSTDGSVAIARRYAAEDERLHVFAEPHAGYVTWLNRGIELARGRYIARMDADDISLPQRFAEQVAYLDEHPECVIVGSRVELIDPHGSPLYVSDQRLTHPEIEAQLLAGNGTALCHPAVMMRRETVQEIGGYRKECEFAEDVDLFLRLAERGRLSNLPQVLLKYRQHLGSVNRTREAIQRRIMRQIINEACAQRGMKPPAELDIEKLRWLSPPEQLTTWSWQALNKGNVAVARRHALAALRHRPLSWVQWKALGCALRGR